MTDFKIRRGLSTTLFTEACVVNPRLVIEDGCWYLCSDTAELYLGVQGDSGLTLKKINGEHTPVEDKPAQTPGADINPELEQTLTELEFAVATLQDDITALQEVRLFEEISDYSELPEVSADNFNPNITYYIQHPENNTIVTYIYNEKSKKYICLNNVVDSEVVGITKAEINASGELVIYYSDESISNLGKIIGKDGKDGLVTSIKIGDKVYTHKDGVIELPEFVTQDYLDKKDFLTKEYSDAINRYIKYEVVPHEGMQIEYRDSEIRLNTSRVKPTEQQAGATATPNQYYVQFKAYAPAGAVAYKEWQGDKRDETLHTFDEDFSGVDKFGRKYSTIWMPIASFDGKNWNLYGDHSTLDKYLGFYYTFEWYDADNNIIESNKVRIILTNDSCHTDLVPDAVARRIDEKIATIHIPEVDFSGYATEEFVREAILAAELGGKDIDLSKYATKEDLEGFATEDYVDEKLATIELPSKIILIGGDATPEND